MRFRTLVPTELADTSPWFIDVLVADGRRDELAAALMAQGIGSRPFYPALHSEPVYSRGGIYPVAERMAREGLWLPSSSKLSDDDVACVCESVRKWAEAPG